MPDLKGKEEFSWYVIKLSLIIIAVFALLNVFPFYTDNFALNSSTFLQQPWSLVTYIFLHADLNHIFSNLFSLVLFGFILEKTVGSRNFLIIFFSYGIFAGIVSLLFYPSVIGASGAIFGIMGVLAVIRPKMVVLAFGIPIPMLVAVAMWAALDLGGIFYPSSIANIGHLAGLCAGIFIGFWIRPRYKVAERKKEKIKIDEEYFRRWEEKYMKH